MQAVRNGLVILLLAGVGYAVYTYVNKPEQTPPPGADTSMPSVTVQAGPAQSGPMGNLASPFSTDPSRAGAPVVARTQGMKLEDAPAFTPSPSSANDKKAAPPAAAIPRLPDARDFEPPPELKSSATAAPRSAATDRSLPPVADATAASINIEAPPRAGKDVTPTAGKFADAWMEAQRALAARRLVEAHAMLSAWYAHPNLLPEDDARLTELLGQLAGTVIYSHTDHLLLPAYVVGESETLEDVAKKHKVPWQLLAKINGRADAGAVRPGESVKVVQGPFHAVVDLRRKEVVLQLHGHYAGRFAIVRSGIDASRLASASAGLAVKEKMNVSGEHYVGLADAESGAKIGIYADDPSPTGLKMPAESSIVLSQRDAADLYDILTWQESTVAIAPP